MEPKLVREKMKSEELAHLVHTGYYGNDGMAKLAVDIEREILTIGGEWHSDGEETLVADGSAARNVWGVNLYPWKAPRERTVYTSLINLKPSVPHRKMEVTDPLVREKIRGVIASLLLNDNETLPAK